MRRLVGLALVLLCACSSDPTAPVSDEGNPLRDSYLEWLKIELADTFCSDGSQYKFFVNYSDASDNLVIAFEPGGACWDYASCSGNGGIRGAANPEGITDTHALLWQFVMPAISRTHGDNAMSDWNFVFFPYCTADVFAGDEIVTYSDPKSADEIVFHHKGRRNMLAAIDWMAAQFKQVPKMLVTGISAGGVGSLVNYAFIRRALKGVERGYLLNDSGPFFDKSVHSKPLYDKVRSSWNIDEWLPTVELAAGFDPDNLGSINVALADEFPDDRLANTFMLRDYNFSLYSYETFYGFPPKEKVLEMWGEDTELLVAQSKTRDNLAYFIPYYRPLNCSHGTTLGEHKGTEIEAAGIDVGDFIDQLLDDDAPLQSTIEDVQPDEDLEPSPSCEMVPPMP